MFKKDEHLTGLTLQEVGGHMQNDWPRINTGDDWLGVSAELLMEK